MWYFAGPAPVETEYLVSFPSPFSFSNSVLEMTEDWFETTVKDYLLNRNSMVTLSKVSLNDVVLCWLNKIHPDRSHSLKDACINFFE